MEHQTVHVVCKIGEGEFDLGPGQTDGADEQAEAIFLMGEDVLNSGADGGFFAIGAGSCLRHRLSIRLAAVNAAGEHIPVLPRLIRL